MYPRHLTSHFPNGTKGCRIIQWRVGGKCGLYRDHARPVGVISMALTDVVMDEEIFRTLIQRLGNRDSAVAVTVGLK